MVPKRERRLMRRWIQRFTASWATSCSYWSSTPKVLNIVSLFYQLNSSPQRYHYVCKLFSRMNSVVLVLWYSLALPNTPPPLSLSKTIKIAQYCDHVTYTSFQIMYHTGLQRVVSKKKFFCIRQLSDGCSVYCSQLTYSRDLYKPVKINKM